MSFDFTLTKEQDDAGFTLYVNEVYDLTRGIDVGVGDSCSTFTLYRHDQQIGTWRTEDEVRTVIADLMYADEQKELEALRKVASTSAILMHTLTDIRKQPPAHWKISDRIRMDKAEVELRAALDAWRKVRL